MAKREPLLHAKRKHVAVLDIPTAELLIGEKLWCETPYSITSAGRNLTIDYFRPTDNTHGFWSIQLGNGESIMVIHKEGK